MAAKNSGSMPGIGTASARSGRQSQNLPQIIQRPSDNASQADSHGRTGSTATDGTRTEAAWVEMQNTLEEVELSASGGAAAFSAEHAKALEELRNAQISLAHAWTRGEPADEETTEVLEHDYGGSKSALGANRALGASGSRARFRRQGRERDESATNATDTYLEKETANDINLARKRREVNDRHFERVNRGVIDVVERLDVVAKKMKGVEMEAQEVSICLYYIAWAVLTWV